MCDRVFDEQPLAPRTAAFADAASVAERFVSVKADEDEDDEDDEEDDDEDEDEDDEGNM